MLSRSTSTRSSQSRRSSECGASVKMTPDQVPQIQNNSRHILKSQRLARATPRSQSRATKDRDLVLKFKNLKMTTSRSCLWLRWSSRRRGLTLGPPPPLGPALG